VHTKDLVDYKPVKAALEGIPAWRSDPSVPRGGDPYTRTEVVAL